MVGDVFHEGILPEHNYHVIEENEEQGDFDEYTPWAFIPLDLGMPMREPIAMVSEVE